jgi:hypothetical protein
VLSDFFIAIDVEARHDQLIGELPASKMAYFAVSLEQLLNKTNVFLLVACHLLQ